MIWSGLRFFLGGIEARLCGVGDLFGCGDLVGCSHLVRFEIWFGWDRHLVRLEWRFSYFGDVIGLLIW